MEIIYSQFLFPYYNRAKLAGAVHTHMGCPATASPVPSDAEGTQEGSFQSQNSRSKLSEEKLHAPLFQIILSLAVPHNSVTSTTAVWRPQTAAAEINGCLT